MANHGEASADVGRRARRMCLNLLRDAQMTNAESDAPTPQMLYGRVVQNRDRPSRQVPPTRKTPRLAGFFCKRLKRLELSTFCMASRRSSQLSYSRVGRSV